MVRKHWAVLLLGTWMVVGCNQGGQVFSVPPGTNIDAGNADCGALCISLLGLADAGSFCMECNLLSLPDGGPGVLCDHESCNTAPPFPE